MELLLMNIDWHILSPKLAEVDFSWLSSSQCNSFILTIELDTRIANTYRPIVRIDLRLDPIDDNSLLRNDQRSL